jgi:deoxyribodipyrimidine photo-lyase
MSLGAARKSACATIIQAMAVERARVRELNRASPGENAAYVLYWMRRNRRLGSNHALAHAAAVANQSGLPLLVYEEPTCTYEAANDRMHTFVLEGVPEIAKGLRRMRAGYFFYPGSRRADGNNVLQKLARKARCMVTDDYPYGVSVPEAIDVACFAVDSSCIVPMSCHEKRAWAAYTIRPKIHRELAEYLKPVDEIKLKKPWRDDLLPGDVAAMRTEVRGSNISQLVANCEIDHAVKPSISFSGGAAAAEIRLEVFLEQRLRRYAREHNEPARHATSELSPYLHFGHISSLQVALEARARASEHKLIADEFLEELIVRRELAFNFARYTENRESLDALPEWCKRTMAKHAKDKRPWVYTARQFEHAETHDALWNATQKELLMRGRIHGYYRMYWGKKIIEWSRSYEEALRIMIQLHDVYALDGRDPNTCTNILWCYGLHDRPWAERPVFGQIRYMSLDGMRRKTDTEAYLAEIAELERTGKDPHRI